MPHPPVAGRKNLFVTLRYLYIVTASCLLFMQVQITGFHPVYAVMVLIALASNVVLCFVDPETLFSWYVEAPVLIADTLWVSWALHSTGAAGSEFFLLYFFVLFLATIGENLMVVLVGGTAVSAANVWLSWDSGLQGPLLFRVVFFYFVSLFYGHVLTQIRAERQRADKGLAWAHELEAKVNERTAELQRLYEESMAANRAKSEFVANMSHELRTPLHIVIGYADMLMDDAAPAAADGHALVKRIRHCASTLLQLVDMVLDLGKLEAGRVPVMNEIVPLDRLLADLQRRERVAPKPGVTLHWEAPHHLPSIETDQAKLAMVLDNLINNALKFTSAGEVVVEIEPSSAADVVAFRVRDTGCGISPEQLSRIFEPFTQAHDRDPSRLEGVGLGLAIVHRYLAVLGGRITVKSQVGQGTTFTVILPTRRMTATPRRLDQAA